MLVMVAKKITGKKSLDVVFWLAAGFVYVFGVVVGAVRQVSTKIKKLKSSQYRRHYNRKQRIVNAKKPSQHIESKRIQGYLLPRNVLCTKAIKPTPHTSVAVLMEIGVGSGSTNLWCSWCFANRFL